MAATSCIKGTAISMTMCFGNDKKICSKTDLTVLHKEEGTVHKTKVSTTMQQYIAVKQ